jgi:hypothetical protein
VSTLASQISDAKRAELVRAANGKARTNVPMAMAMAMGMRVTAGPDAVPVPTDVELAEAGVSMAMASAARTVEGLLARARASESARIRNLADKVGTLLADLAGRVEAEEAQRQEREAAEAARKELADKEAALQRQLDELRQKRQALRGTRGDSTASTSGGGVPAKEIRQWAAGRGIKVKPTGRIPRDVVEVWRSEMSRPARVGVAQ